MNLENDLKRALRPESPAPGFAGRVLDRIERERAPQTPAWWRAAAASVALVAVLGGFVAHQVSEQRRAEGELAREQVLQALQIANEKVRIAQQEVRAIGSNH